MYHSEGSEEQNQQVLRVDGKRHEDPATKHGTTLRESFTNFMNTRIMVLKDRNSKVV